MMNVCMQLTQYLSHDLIHEGWLYKTGPRAGSSYKKRWMSLGKRRLFYFARPLVSVIQLTTATVCNLLLVVAGGNSLHLRHNVQRPHQRVILTIVNHWYVHSNVM